MTWDLWVEDLPIVDPLPSFRTRPALNELITGWGDIIDVCVCVYVVCINKHHLPFCYIVIDIFHCNNGIC